MDSREGAVHAQGAALRATQEEGGCPGSACLADLSTQHCNCDQPQHLHPQGSLFKAADAYSTLPGYMLYRGSKQGSHFGTLDSLPVVCTMV